MIGIKTLLSLGSILLVYGSLMRTANPSLHRPLMWCSLMCCLAGFTLLLGVWQWFPPEANLWVHVVIGEQHIATLLFTQTILLGWGVACLAIQTVIDVKRGSFSFLFYRLGVPSWWLAFISAMLVYR